ncbi:MAG: hypothetical protein ACTHM1_09635 [Solirubrobacteraceae bacterium]
MPDSGHYEPSRRIEVASTDQERTVFRFVKATSPIEPGLSESFLSDAALGKQPRGRSAAIPGHMDGMSAFRTLALARERWQDIARLARQKDPTRPIRVGEHIAAVVLSAGHGFAYEDLGQDDGHMTIWGDANALAHAVVEIVPAQM